MWSSNKVFVRNVGPIEESTREKLEKAFGPCGKIEAIKTSPRRQIAVIVTERFPIPTWMISISTNQTFDSNESASEAISKLNQYHFHDSPLLTPFTCPSFESFLFFDSLEPALHLEKTKKGVWLSSRQPKEPKTTQKRKGEETLVNLLPVRGQEAATEEDHLATIMITVMTKRGESTGTPEETRDRVQETKNTKEKTGQSHQAAEKTAITLERIKTTTGKKVTRATFDLLQAPSPINPKPKMESASFVGKLVTGKPTDFLILWRYAIDRGNQGRRV